MSNVTRNSEGKEQKPQKIQYNPKQTKYFKERLNFLCQNNLLYWLVSESFRFEYKPYREYCLRFSTSYHEFSTERCLSVPENASCIPRLQSTEPPRPLHDDVLIAQSCLLRQTKLDFPLHEEHPSLFQYKFCSLPF